MSFINHCLSFYLEYPNLRVSISDEIATLLYVELKCYMVHNFCRALFSILPSSLYRVHFSQCNMKFSWHHNEELQNTMLSVVVPLCLVAVMFYWKMLYLIYERLFNILNIASSSKTLLVLSTGEQLLIALYFVALHCDAKKTSCCID